MRMIGKSGKGLLAAACLVSAHAQESDVPLMRPDEEKVIQSQDESFNQVLETTLAQAAKSTVRIWGKPARSRKAAMLAYGIVVGQGNQVLTKWSEIERFENTLHVQAGGGQSFKAEVAGVFTDEDLVLLNLAISADEGRAIKDVLVPVTFSETTWSYGQFVSAPQPDGKLGGFGVVSVLERNLRETDRAHLGIMADPDFRGKGVKIAVVQPEHGAAEAGIQTGDVILDMDGREISGLQELRNALTNKMPGDKVKLKIETAGKERSVEVLLTNRPIYGELSPNRLNQMERMGGEPNLVNSGFSRVVQSDMKIQSNQVGGPVVDLQGKIVGVTMARADRTKTYLMSGSAVADLLKGKADTVAEAREKMESQRQQLAQQRRELMPKMRLPSPQDQKSMNPERARRHMSDMERLLGRINRELEALEDRYSR
jgi:membrane-associated protease RseP (regulator of RpoE activity)